MVFLVPNLRNNLRTYRHDHNCANLPAVTYRLGNHETQMPTPQTTPNRQTDLWLAC